MTINTLGFIAVGDTTLTGSGSFTGNNGFSGANSSTQVSFDYGRLTSIGIDDANGTFDDDPTQPSWAGSGSEVAANGVVPHRQVNASEMTINGTVYAPGTLQIEAEYRVILQDENGTTYELIGISAGTYSTQPGWDPSWATVGPSMGIIGFSFSGPNGWPPAGATLTYVENAADGPSIAWPSIPPEEEVPCFTAGTLIETPLGARRIEELHPGDMVMTKDHGPQPLRWIGSKKLAVLDLALRPKLRAIRIQAGALGENTPTADLLVSPEHRILVRSKIARRIFGTSEVLVAAKQLLQLEGIDIAQDLNEVEYFHILFDRHEVVTSNGAETESLFTGPQALASLSEAAVEEIVALFPDLRDADYQPIAARHLASGRQARKLTVHHLQYMRPIISA